MLHSSLDDLVCLLALPFLDFPIKNGRKLSYSDSKVKNKRYDNLLRKSCSHILFFQIQLSFVDVSLVLREHWRKFHNTINLMHRVWRTNYNHNSVTVYPIDRLQSNFCWRPPNCKQHFANMSQQGIRPFRAPEQNHSPWVCWLCTSEDSWGNFLGPRGPLVLPLSVRPSVPR